MAFDGPGPFDGDASFALQMELEHAPEDAEAILEEALATVCEQEYVEVDDGVCAWIAAELIATHVGAPGPDPLPAPFASLQVTDVSDLAPLARAALAAVAEVGRSELAELWEERGEGTLERRFAALHARLS